MEAIATHPVLRHYVRRFFFLNALLDRSFDHFDTWQSSIDSREPYWEFQAREGDHFRSWDQAPRIILTPDGCPSDGRTWSKAESVVKTPDKNLANIRTILTTRETLNRHHERMTSLLCSQNNSMNNNSIQQVFEDGLGCFSKLQDVKIYGSSPLYPRHDTYKLLGGIDQYRYPFVSALQLDTLIQYPWDATEPYRYHFVNKDYSAVAKSTLDMLKALGSAKVNLRSFDFGTLPWSIWQKTADMVYWPEYHSYATKMMNSLKELTAEFFLLDLGNHDPLSASISFQITEFLNAARSVETVDVGFNDRQHFARTGEQCRIHDRIPDWEEDNAADVSQILERVWWPNLKVIRLYGCGLTQHAFFTFMKRHSQTLRELVVGDLRLIVGPPIVGAQRQRSDWRPIIEAIAPAMSLEKVCFGHLLDETQEARIIRFIECRENDPDQTRSVESYQYDAVMEWEDHSRCVADYLQRGGLGEYPEWTEYS